MPARSFRAFVSYCHADRTFAAKLQRRLEGYRLPRRLAASLAPLPGQPAGRIGPVFRDRADLSASEDLSAAVREAIAASSALVVVASPDAARSHWVSREIALFRELHPNAPVLTALARGEPAEGLPAALRENGIEPLAADFRREGDGPRLAFLKVVAGIAGLPLDALIQRDAQRHVRRVTVVTLGALAVALMMTAMTGVALVSRAQAVRERQQAEGLIEFMLTDLREKLRGVGRLEIMQEVNKRALEYYSEQGDLSRLPDESLLKRARILHAMGEDDFDEDRREAASAELAEAHRVTEMLLARKPNDIDRIFTHAQSEFWLGNAAWKAKDFDTARLRFERYAVLAGRLVVADPGNKDWQMEAGYAASNLGSLALADRKRPDLAQAAFERAGRHFETARRLAPDDVEVTLQLADNDGWIADSLYRQGEFASARLARQRQLKLIESLLADDIDNAQFQQGLVGCLIGLSRAAARMARTDEAISHLERAKLIADKLARADPENRASARQQAAVTVRLAGLLSSRPPRIPRTNALVAAALTACTTPKGLAGKDEEMRVCEMLRTRESGVSTH